MKEDCLLIGYTVRETAANLRVHEETVRRWIHRGLPALNVGSEVRPDYRIEPAVLRSWLDAGKPAPPPARTDGGDG